MTAADAAYKVLVEAGRPLHYKEITDRILTAGLWTTAGKTPWDTVAARVTGDIRLHGMKSRFVKTEPGVFAARTTGDLFADMTSTTTARSTPSKASDTPSEPSRPVPKPSNGQMSFLDAAEHVLRGLKPGTRMHYRDITNRALEAELIRTRGKTPDATMAAQIGTDIRRRDEREEPQRFVSRRGIIGLAEELPVGIAEQIRKHNVKARAKLLKRAREGSFVHFEELVEKLLVEMGFEDVEKTSSGRDGGIDVRGTLVVGDVVRMRMAVQAKRWKGNVTAPVVQQVRGSLGAHEQGLIITTSDFSTGARDEAERRDASPVALMNGEQLSVLLAKYQIGAERKDHAITMVEPRENPSS